MRVTAACVVLALVPAPAPAQSLGDAARREHARRRRVEASGDKARVITESELSAGRTASAAAPKADATRPSAVEDESALRDESEDGSAAPPSDDAGRRDQEDMWRGRMLEARNSVEFARRRHEYLSTLVMVPGKYYVDEESGRAVITSTEQLQQLTAEALADRHAAEQALADLEERARRAGVPPGWLR
jgi:hypothetical protein